MRYRPSAGRLIIELFYGSDHIERSRDNITLQVSGLARKLHVRPQRLVDLLEWMERYGLITHLMFNRKAARLKLRAPEGEEWYGEGRDADR